MNSTKEIDRSAVVFNERLYLGMRGHVTSHPGF